MDAVRQKVFEKNRARGYYTTCEICEGKGWFFGQKCIVCDGIGVLKDGKVEDD
jgi:DnaJ-class molecular chaperone